jgi:hypothetical protein
LARGNEFVYDARGELAMCFNNLNLNCAKELLISYGIEALSGAMVVVPPIAIILATKYMWR